MDIERKIHIELSEHEALLLLNLVKEQAAEQKQDQRIWLKHWRQLTVHLQDNIEASYRQDNWSLNYLPDYSYYRLSEH